MLFSSVINWNLLKILYLIIIFVVSFLSTYFIIPYIIRFMKKRKFVGYDIHKNARPEIAESGGLSILFGFTIASLLLTIFFKEFINEIIIFLLTVIFAGIIGFIDDRVKLRSRYKIVLSIFCGGAIFIANFVGFVNISSPVIPILDRTRLTIIYPFTIPIIVAIFTNTVNMLEGYNGEGSGTCFIAVSFLFICSLILNSAEGIIFSVPIMAVIIAFFLFNKFPAKIFPGDIGTLSMGAMIACVMFFGSLEVAAFCALLIHIFNSFYVIYSVKGFFESDKIRENREDIILLENDQIMASDQKKAALTLPRLILAKGPLTEPELVKNFYAISLICGFFSIIFTLLIQITMGNLNITVLIITILIIIAPSVYILYKFPRIRGIIVLMIILLTSIIIFLILIEYIILAIPFPVIDLGLLRFPTNLLFIFLLGIFGLVIWYFITIKYFWMEINKMKINQHKNY